MTLRIFGSVLLILLLNSNDLSGQRKPTQSDFLPATLGFGVAAGLEVFGKSRLIPPEPRWSKPNRLDQTMRERIFWGTDGQNAAITWSDRLLYGISFSSLLWGPLLDDNRERSALVNYEVLTANALVTNFVKILAARERPYSYYSTMESRGADDFASFFSGHTSVAFSQAITNALMLSQSYPDREVLIWASLVGSAGLTAYFRVAGDQHYFTDVIAGAVVGSAIAWLITSYELDRFPGPEEQSSNWTINLKIPLGSRF